MLPDFSDLIPMDNGKPDGDNPKLLRSDPVIGGIEKKGSLGYSSLQNDRGIEDTHYSTENQLAAH